ncbi:MAG: hypothetical protein VCD34_09175 [Planctomycetota bacterium]|jgi:hypothetical protein
MKLKCFYLLALSGAALLSPSTSHADSRFFFGLSFGNPDFRVSLSNHRRVYTPSRPIVVAPRVRTTCAPHRVQRVHRVLHRHCWTARPSRVWVAPVHRTVFCGYEPCGRAIYREITIRPGYFRTVFTEHCSCGASR